MEEKKKGRGSERKKKRTGSQNGICSARFTSKIVNMTENNW
jgi:hypothetical protein